MSESADLRYAQRSAAQGISRKLGIAIARAEAIHSRHSRRLSLSLLGASLVIGTSCLIIASN